jgi:hypothetical protein
MSTGRPAEDEIELDLYFNYTGKINDTFAVDCRRHLVRLPGW